MKVKILITLLLLPGFIFSFLKAQSALADSEVDHLLNSSHVTSWAYFRDPAKQKWYISSADGTTYALGLNNRGHSSWVTIANGDPVANVDFAGKMVSLSSNTSELTPSDKYLAISLVAGESQEYVYNDKAKQWADLINGKQMPLDWYFFRVESNSTWYIVLIEGSDSTILRLKLNSDFSGYDWQKPVDSSGMSISTANWRKEFFQQN